MEEYKCSTKKTNSQAKGKKNRKIITTETVKASVQGLFDISYTVDIVSKWDKTINIYVAQLPIFNYLYPVYCYGVKDSYVLGSCRIDSYVGYEYFIMILKGIEDWGYNRKRDKVKSIALNRHLGLYNLLLNNSVEGYRWYLLTSTNHPTYSYERYMDDLRISLYGKKSSSLRYFSVFESYSSKGYKPHYHFAVLLEEGLDVGLFLREHPNLNLYYKAPVNIESEVMRISSYLTKSGNSIQWNRRSKHLSLNTRRYLDIGGISGYIDMLNDVNGGWSYHKTVHFKERINTDTGEVYENRMIVFKRKKQPIAKPFKGNSLLLKVRKKYYTKIISIAYDTLDE